MIIEKLENVSRKNDSKTIKSFGRGDIGVQVSASGHLLIINSRVNLPSAIKRSSIDRSSIKSFSPSSAARMRRYLRTSMSEYNVLITLTYPVGLGTDGERCKRDLKVFLQRLKRSAPSMGGNIHAFSAFWFLEFQRRGAIHYHIFTTHRFPKDWIKRSWYEIVGSEDERHLRAGTRIEAIRGGKRGISAYAAKYAAKHVQKEVPEDFGWVGRFWGVTGRRDVMSADSWLEPEDAERPSVIRAINKIESAVKRYEERGKCKIVRTDGGAIVVYMKSKFMEVEIANLVDRLETAATLFRPHVRPSMFDENVWGKGGPYADEVL